ncbi:YbaB/EbfC family DNA-binding protein [Actinomadura logoneensis]|uniref:YbaB/EbfC family DNA-binding protein n=1 Tax=Actinomadura logoneensis TaxID=2293572 RepID=A0A372JHQ5_9ACTN|nr:YbaB/EbfC family nucleoid-associated protein [Actinomadura logoneensis]RFU39480.1 YbaB/EbfC family DNA-binding protein [Actinomadura logoneensis]
MRAEWQAHIDELLGQYREQRDRLKGLQEKLEGIEASAEAADGMVRVTVDRQGRLTALELDPRVYRKLASAELSEAVLEASRDASAQVADKIAEAMRDITPAGPAGEGAGPGGIPDLGKLLPEKFDMDSIREHYGLLGR